MYSVIFEEPALNDVEAAKSYYQSIRLELSEKFTQELSIIIDSIVSHPSVFQKRIGDSRFAKMKSFPYVLIYVIEGKTIIVDAVFNTSQNPDKILNKI